MELAIELAREAAAEGEVPVGAVVLDAGGAVIGSGRNLREAHGASSGAIRFSVC